jgi:RimJ/RimL family protein N-acetyltransferase
MRDGRESESVEFPVETRRLILRGRRSADEVAMNALLANPAVGPNLCATIPADTGTAIAIVDRRTDRIVGGALYGSTGLGAGVEVCLWIGEPDWGLGYGTEAAHALIDRAFACGTVGVVWASHRATNPRGRRVIEKCGFQFRGSGMVRVAGRGAFPIERFALDRSTWTSLKAWGGIKGDVDNAHRETAA